MGTALFNTVPISSLTAAHLGYRGTDEYTVNRGAEALKKYTVTYKSHVGKIIAVTDSRRTVQVMSDIWEEWTERTVTVWSDLQQAGVTFVSDSAGYGTPATASAYEVDATPEVVAKYRRWVATVSLPNKAARVAETHGKALEGAAETKRQEVVFGLRRGRTYEVVRGRKYPHGMTGVLVWHGENRFGPTAMLATTDRRDARGRYADVIFINPNNLKRVQDAAFDAELDAVSKERAAIPAEMERVYRETLHKDLTEVAKEWGVSYDKVVERAVEVAKQEVDHLRKRHGEIADVIIYADGPNFDNDMRRCNRLSDQVKAYERMTAALAT